MKMSDVEEVLHEIYNTLVEIRYPEITMAEPKNVDKLILTGDNRISLLSWLLAEKSPDIAATLEKLYGPPLEDELLKYYTEIGICINKDLLLGNCTWKEQLPTLRLLTDFMKFVHMEAPEVTLDIKSQIEELFVTLTSEDIYMSPVSNVKAKFSYSEAEEFFKEIKKDLPEHTEISIKIEPDAITENLHHFHIKEEIKEENMDDLNARYCTETQKFIEAFSDIDKYSLPKTNQTKNTSYCMDTDIKNIYTDFSTLQQVLRVKNELSTTTIPKGLKKLNTPLSEIVADTVISIKKLQAEN